MKAQSMAPRKRSIAEPGRACTSPKTFPHRSPNYAGTFRAHKRLGGMLGNREESSTKHNLQADGSLTDYYLQCHKSGKSGRSGKVK